MLSYFYCTKKVLEILKVQILKGLWILWEAAVLSKFFPHAKEFPIFHPDNSFELCTATSSALIVIVKSALTDFHHPLKCPGPGWTGL